MGLSHTGLSSIDLSLAGMSMTGLPWIGPSLTGLSLIGLSCRLCSAVENICGRPNEVNHQAVPAACFTHPEIAMVGLTEEQAKDKVCCSICNTSM